MVYNVCTPTNAGRRGGGVYSYHLWPYSDDHRPSHPYNAGTKHVGLGSAVLLRTESVFSSTNVEQREAPAQDGQFPGLSDNAYQVSSAECGGAETETEKGSARTRFPWKNWRFFMKISTSHS